MVEQSTYIIWDQDNGELIMAHTKSTSTNLTITEVVQMIMMEQACEPDEYAEIDEPEDASYKVYAVFEGNQYPIFEDDLNTYTFEDKHYEKLCRRIQDYKDSQDEEL